MYRGIIALLVLFAPGLMLATTSGCEEKTTSVQRKEEVHQSEPKMTSPGKEVVE